MNIIRYMFFDFLISLLNIEKDFEVLSPFIQKWTPFFLLAGGLFLLFDEKSAKVLHYFGLDCVMLAFLQIFYSQAVIQRTIVDFPALLETGFVEKIWFVAIQPVIPTSRRIRSIFV
jgi:hypothetical protein